MSKLESNHSLVIKFGQFIKHYNTKNSATSMALKLVQCPFLFLNDLL